MGKKMVYKSIFLLGNFSESQFISSSPPIQSTILSHLWLSEMHFELPTVHRKPLHAGFGWPLGCVLKTDRENIET